MAASDCILVLEPKFAQSGENGNQTVESAAREKGRMNEADKRAYDVNNVGIQREDAVSAGRIEASHSVHGQRQRQGLLYIIYYICYIILCTLYILFISSPSEARG